MNFFLLYFNSITTTKIGCKPVRIYFIVEKIRENKSVPLPPTKSFLPTALLYLYLLILNLFSYQS